MSLNGLLPTKKKLEGEGDFKKVKVLGGSFYFSYGGHTHVGVAIPKYVRKHVNMK